MQKYVRLSVILFLLLLSENVSGQVTIWSEDFESYADPSTVAVDNNSDDVGVDWSRANTSISGTFQVSGANAIFGARSWNGTRCDDDAVNGSIWTTEVIDVSAYTGPFEIGITYAESGNLEASDWIDIEYNRNGSGWVDFPGGQQTDDFAGPITITENIPGSTSSIQIRVKMYQDGGGEKHIFDNVYVYCPTCTPLPVEMGKISINNGYLEWATYSEINNSHFEIMVSDNGINFETIDSIEGHGNSIVPINYSLPLIDIEARYLKLKQVDFDGTYVYSEIIVLNPIPITQTKIIPNPNDGNFIMELPDMDEDVLLVVYNTMGEELYSKVAVTDYGTGLVAFDLKGLLPRGIYYIVSTSRNYLINKRIVVR
jgi:hypothetical protein